MSAVFAYLLARVKEKSSWTGLGLIAIGLLALIWPSFVTVAAWLAIAYGAWAFFTKG